MKKSHKINRFALKALIGLLTTSPILNSCNMQTNLPIEPQEQTPLNYTQFGDAPYDRKIGNGNYVLHNFLGENTDFSLYNSDEILDGTNCYLSEADTWLKTIINDIKTLNQDSDNLDYFDKLINKLSNQKLYIDNEIFWKDKSFENIIRTTVNAVDPFIRQIVKHLPTKKQCYAFKTAYYILSKQAHEESLGFRRKDQVVSYDEEKTNISYIIIDHPNIENLNIRDGIDDQDLFTVTNEMDKLIDIAAKNMHINPDAARKVVEIGINTRALDRFYDYTLSKRPYPSEIGLGINEGINTAIWQIEHFSGENKGLEDNLLSK